VARSHAAPDDVVVTPRLLLIALTGPVIAEVLAGDPGAFLEHVGVGYPAEWPTEDRHVLELRRRQIGEGVDHRWLLRAVVTRDEPAMVGRIGFHGPPDPNGMVEIGYKIDAQYRRQGYGFECAERLIAAAERLPQVTVVRASIAPDNVPSLRIAERLGLQRVGEQIDEIDGLELVFERNAGAGARVGGGRLR
jgi:RimJ/RimL family protein N-acetyltransferase